MGAGRVLLIFRAVAGLLAAAALAACQAIPPLTRAALAEHREVLAEAGLSSAITVNELRASLEVPPQWRPLPLQKSVLYTHQQWRSQSRRTAVGITYIHMPLPLSTQTLVWFVVNEAGKRSADGKIIRQWSDSAGRQWFECENAKYHMTGYVMTSGLDAWINYCGYRNREPKMAGELDFGEKSLETITPVLQLTSAQ
jgi:hypothetical protein